jgi:hypothetical protein
MEETKVHKKNTRTSKRPRCYERKRRESRNLWKRIGAGGWKRCKKACQK